jgi:hypothetical protein
MPLRRGSRFGGGRHREGDLSQLSLWSLSGAMIAASVGISTGMVTMTDGSTPGYTSAFMRHLGGLSAPSSVSVVDLDPRGQGGASSTLTVKAVSKVTPLSGGGASGYVVMGARSAVTPLGQGASSATVNGKATGAVTPRAQGGSSSTLSIGARGAVPLLGSSGASGYVNLSGIPLVSPQGAGAASGRVTLGARGAVTPLGSAAASGLLEMGNGQPPAGFRSPFGRWLGGLADRSAVETPLGGGAASGRVTMGATGAVTPRGSAGASAQVSTVAPATMTPRGQGGASALVATIVPGAINLGSGNGASGYVTVKAAGAVTPRGLAAASAAATVGARGAVTPRGVGGASSLLALAEGATYGWPSPVMRWVGGLHIPQEPNAVRGNGAASGLVLVKGATIVSPRGQGGASGRVIVGSGEGDPAFRGWFLRWAGGLSLTTPPFSPVGSSGAASGRVHMIMEARLEIDSTDGASGYAFMPAAVPVGVQGVGVASGRVNVRNRPSVLPLASGAASGMASFATPVFLTPLGGGASAGGAVTQDAGGMTPRGGGASLGSVIFGPLNLTPGSASGATGMVDMRAGTVLITVRGVGISSSVLTFARIELLTPRGLAAASGFSSSTAVRALRIDPLSVGAAHGRVLMDGYAVDPTATAQRAVLLVATDEWQMQQVTDEFSVQSLDRWDLVRVNS